MAERTRKRKLLAILFLAIGLSGILFLALYLPGCHPDKELVLVWDKPTPPTPQVQAPTGFAISPFQAYEAVRKKPWEISSKHVWHIYADDKSYYVIDSFLGSSPTKALKTGVVVDGQTGAILEQPAK